MKKYVLIAFLLLALILFLQVPSLAQESYKSWQAHSSHSYGYFIGWSPDGKKIASTGTNETKFWDASGNLIKSFGTGGWRLRWSPDGSKIAFANVSEVDGSFVVVIDASSGAELKKIKLGEGILSYALDWSPDGKKIAAATDGSVRVLDAETLNFLAALSHDGIAYYLDWSPDGSKIASTFTSVNFSVTSGFNIWDVNSGNLLKKVLTEDSDAYVDSIEWSPDSSKVAAVWKANDARGAKFYAVKIFDGSNGAELKKFAPGYILDDVSWSKDGSKVITIGDQVIVWNYSTGSLLGSSETISWLSDLEVSPNGANIAALGQDGILYVWDSASLIGRATTTSTQPAASTTTQPPFIPDAIPKAEEITFKAFYRDLRGNAHESSGGVVDGVKEGELVAFEPSGNLTGEKVEWFDEWNSGKYKIATPEFIKDNLFNGKLIEGEDAKTDALGITSDIERVIRNQGIYRTFSEGEHTISLYVDDVKKDSVKIEVKAAQASETKKVAVILASYDNAKPTRCCDGRDRDEDGFTGYGKNDDRDGWDSYEYENIIFSRVNKYYSESSNGRLRFDWKIFDDNGKWVYVEPFFESGGGFSAIELINRAKNSIGGFDGKVMVVLPIDAHLKFTQSAGVTDAFGNMLVNENSPLTVPAHELGHSLGVGGVFLELYPDAPLGFLSDIKKWGVMYNDYKLGDNFPPLMDAWSRVRIGWASEDLKSRDGKFSLNLAQKSDKVLTVRTTPILSYILGTRLLIEARSRAPHLTYYDRGAPDTGVVIYRVNSLANKRDQVEIGGVLKNVGDELKVGFTNANFKLTKNNLHNDGTAEVEINTGVMSNTVGAIVDGVTGFVNWVSGKSGLGLNETADLDLHAYYTLEGKNYHVGLNYETGIYETQNWVVAGGDLLIGEYIFVPESVQNLRFEVSNKKIRDLLLKHPEASSTVLDESKFSIVYMKYDENGEQTLTNPEITSLSLSEDKKTLSIPETGFLEKQTVAHLSDKTINRRLIVLREKEIIFSQDYVGDEMPEVSESLLQKTGNYLIIEQSSGPSNEIYKNDALLEEDYSKFMKLAYAENDNIFSIESRPTLAKTSAGGGIQYILGGVVALLVIAAAFFFLRKKQESSH